MSGNREAEVVIVGAGPVGAALACALGGAGIPVALADRTPPQGARAADGRAYAIAAGARVLLESAGVWRHLPAPPQPILDILVTNGRPDRRGAGGWLHFDSREMATTDDPSAPGGAFGWMLPAPALAAALAARLAELPQVAVLAPAEVRPVRVGNVVRVTLNGGAELPCRLLVAADGRNSAIRRAAAIPVTRLSYGQSALVFRIGHDRPHHGVAAEHFVPTGPFAQLPLPATEAEAHVSAMVWSVPGREAAALASLPGAALAVAVAQRLGGRLGAVRLLDRPQVYPLSAHYAARYTAERLALAGDAAHSMHPVAGQGLNLGLRDVALLAELVAGAAARGEDVGSPELLARYQRGRRADGLKLLAVTDVLVRLFGVNFPPLDLARSLGLRAVAHIPPLRRLFMREAMGG